MDHKKHLLNLFMVIFFIGNVLLAQLIFSPIFNMHISTFEFSFLGFSNSIIADIAFLFLIFAIGLLIFKRAKSLLLYLLIITFTLNIIIFTLYIYSSFFNVVFSLNLAAIDQESEGFVLLVILRIIRMFFLDLRFIFFIPSLLMLILFINFVKSSKDAPLTVILRRKILFVTNSIFLLILTSIFVAILANSNPKSNIDINLFTTQNGGVFNFYLRKAFNIPIGRQLQASFSDDELNTFINEVNTNQGYYKNPLNGQSFNTRDADNGLFEDYNLFLIQIESFTNFFINMEINGKYVTPFLNSVIEDHFLFSNVLQSVGRGNTSDAEFSVLTGLFGSSYEFTIDWLYNDYKENNKVLDVDTLPALFNTIGHKTMYFHGNTSGFFNRDFAMPHFGFQETFFREEFLVKRGVPHWSYLEPYELYGRKPWITDRIMLDWALNESSDALAENKNFFTHVSLTQPHAPFHRFDGLEEIDWGRQVRNSEFRIYLDTIHYIDKVLENFFNSAMEELPNTLFIMYSDHGPILRGSDLARLTNANSSIKQTYELFNVPVFFISNTDTLHNHLDHRGFSNEVLSLARSQRDIFRTIVNFWNLWDETTYVFGVNMFSDEPAVAFDVRMTYFLTDYFFSNLRNTQRILLHQDITRSEIAFKRDIVYKHFRMNNHFLNINRRNVSQN